MTDIKILDKPKKIIKNKLFPNNNDAMILDKVMIDDESVSYISIPEDADKITKIIQQHCYRLNLTPLSLTITDAMSGVGGNVLSFASNFMSVNAIELDIKRYQFLVNNIDAYKLSNVLHYCDDCLNIIYKFTQQDIIFFDPPWGGKTYKDQNNIRLTISNISIEDICIKLFDDNESISVPYLICVKLPKNYDIRNLYFKLSNENKKFEIYCYDLTKMYIVIIQKKK